MASSARPPSPRIAASATLDLQSGEKLRRLAMIWNPLIQAEFHLSMLSEFRGPLLLVVDRSMDVV